MGKHKSESHKHKHASSKPKEERHESSTATLRHVMGKGGAPSIEITDLLETFLHPISVSEFLNKEFRNRAVAVTGFKTNRFESIVSALSNLNLHKLLEDTASDNIFVWMREADGKLSSFEAPDVAAAEVCHRAGASLYFRASEGFEEETVRTMADQLGMGFGQLHRDGGNRGEVEVFISRTGHKTDWHFDFMENFTFQLKGSKRWKLQKGQVTHPLRGCTPHYTRTDTRELQMKAHHISAPTHTYDAPSQTDFEEGTRRSTYLSDILVLTEGSVLYFPAGMWHRVECEEDSISINISLVGATWADFMAENLRQAMWTDDSFRQLVRYDNIADAQTRVQNLLAKLQTQLLPQLTGRALLPPAVVLPNTGVVFVRDYIVDKAAEQSSKKQKSSSSFSGRGTTEGLEPISVTTRLKLNPVGVIVRGADAPSKPRYTTSAQGEQGDGSDMEDVDSDEFESDLDSDNSEEDETLALADNELFCSVHVNFGTEDLQSLSRTRVVYSKDMDACLECIRLTPRSATFSTSSLVQTVGLSEETILGLIKALMYAGGVVTA